MRRRRLRVALSWLKGRRRKLLLLALVVLTGFVTATARLFIWPTVDSVRRVDAIVLFVGGRGERLALAEQLMDRGVAGELVIPNGLAVEWPQGNRACLEDRPYEVRCPRPDPDTTIGEAQVIAKLADDESWDSLLIVTSTYQVSRASMLLGRCFEGEVLTAPANPDLSSLEWGSRVTHEWLAWVRAAIQRSC